MAVYAQGDSNRNRNYHLSSGYGGGGANTIQNRQYAAGWYGPTTIGADQSGFRAGAQAEAIANRGTSAPTYYSDGTRVNDPTLGGGGGGYSGGGSGSASGGSSGSGNNTQNNLNGSYSTSITAGPIWGDQQVQNQVNSTKAEIRNQAGNLAQKLSQNLAGRGFGPVGGGLGTALRAALWANAGAQGAKGEQDLRWGAAKDNAQHQLASEQGRANEGIGLGQLLLSQRGQDISLENAQRQNILNMLMSSMGGLA